MKTLLPKLSLPLLVLSLAHPAVADDLAKIGRALVAEKSVAVVTIRMVIKETFSFGAGGANASESIAETTGSVIQEDGLVVASLSATDPAKLYEDLFDDWEEDDFNIDIRSDVSELTLVMSDGEEIPTEIVLRDNDLDLAFIRPRKEPTRPFKHFELTEATAPQQFERLAVVYRMGKVANRGVTAASPPRFPAYSR